MPRHEAIQLQARLARVLNSLIIPRAAEIACHVPWMTGHLVAVVSCRQHIMSTWQLAIENHTTVSTASRT
jgi:hypothetical protein